jgi:hypothetical protein
MSPRPSEVTAKAGNSNAKKQRPVSKVNISSPARKKVKKAAAKVKVVENEKRLDSCNFFNYGIDDSMNRTYDNQTSKVTKIASSYQRKDEEVKAKPAQPVDNQTVEFSQLLDSDILIKEYELGKQLISHASQKLEEKSYSNMLYESHLTNEDFKVIGIFLSLLFSIRDREDKIFEKWDQIQQSLANPAEIYEIQNNLSSLIEKPDFVAENTHKFRDQFVNYSSHNSQSQSIVSIKEYL